MIQYLNQELSNLNNCNQNQAKKTNMMTTAKKFQKMSQQRVSKNKKLQKLGSSI